MLVLFFFLALVVAIVVAVKLCPINITSLRIRSLSVHPSLRSICFYHITYKDKDHQFEIGTCSLTLAKHGRIMVTADTVLLQVYASSRTPSWIHRIRYNVVTAVLSTDHERVRTDHFHTQILFGNEESADNVGLTLRLENWVRKSIRGRVFTMNGTAQLWTNWEDHQPEEGGKLTLIVRNSSWIQLKSGWNAWDPIDWVDVHLTSADVTFDHFRVRDAELPRQLARHAETWRRKGLFNVFGLNLSGYHGHDD